MAARRLVRSVPRLPDDAETTRIRARQGGARRRRGTPFRSSVHVPAYDDEILAKRLFLRSPDRISRHFRHDLRSLRPACERRSTTTMCCLQPGGIAMLVRSCRLTCAGRAELPRLLQCRVGFHARRAAGKSGLQPAPRTDRGRRAPSPRSLNPARGLRVTSCERRWPRCPARSRVTW